MVVYSLYLSDIPFNVTETRLQDLLDECEEGEIHVERHGNCATCDFQITFVSQGGNHAEMKVNGTRLTGNKVSVTVRTIQDGGLFMDPIPGEFLRMPSTEPQASAFRTISISSEILPKEVLIILHNVKYYIC